MAVDKLNPQALTAAFYQHQRSIHWVIVAVLVLYLLALSADLIWRIIPEPQPSAQNFANGAATSLEARGNNRSASNIAALQRLNLFGTANKKAEQTKQPVVEDAPETRLNLTLSGAVVSSSPNLGAAIIEHRGAQATYGVGDKIEGTNATLRQVQMDRVIIRNGVRDETLMLEGVDFNKANRERQQQTRSATATQPNKSKNTRGKQALSAEAVAARQQLKNAPDSFIDFISVAPYRENNQTVGYRVSPGKNPTLFNEVGLQRGDVITQINGLEVTSFEALSALRSSESLELTLNRKDEVITLYLELPESDEI